MRVLHLNTQFASLGGVESVLRHHHNQDASVGIDSRFIALWEPKADGFPRARFLDFARSTSVREARRRRAAAWPDFPPDIAVHHTLWGQSFLADLDGPACRILFLHSDTPELPRQLGARLPLMDGVLAVSDVLADRVRTAAPDWPADRLARIDYPIHPPASFLSPPSRGTNSPLVIGFAGRLDTVQKRVERFIDLAAQPAMQRFPWRLEFLGDGPERLRLEASLPNRERVVFHGRQSGQEYWRILSGWDAIVFTSDYEGTPIALIEAMAAGVLPVHPAIGCGGDAYAREIDSDLVYPAGDINALATLLGRLAGWPGTRRDEARARARNLSLRHDPDVYLRTFKDFATRIAGLSPRPKPPLRQWGFPMDRLAFGQWEWLAGWKRKLAGRHGFEP